MGNGVWVNGYRFLKEILKIGENKGNVQMIGINPFQIDPMKHQ